MSSYSSVEQTCASHTEGIPDAAWSKAAVCLFLDLESLKIEAQSEVNCNRASTIKSCRQVSKVAGRSQIQAAALEHALGWLRADRQRKNC